MPEFDDLRLIWEQQDMRRARRRERRRRQQAKEGPTRAPRFLSAPPVPSFLNPEGKVEGQVAAIAEGSVEGNSAGELDRPSTGTSGEIGRVGGNSMGKFDQLLKSTVGCRIIVDAGGDDSAGGAESTEGNARQPKRQRQWRRPLNYNVPREPVLLD
eukprot:4012343-Alexandrium_andersonii.AAC.1